MKKKLTIAEVKHVAKLANLPLTKDRILEFQKKLSETIDYVDQLNELATAGITVTSQVTNKENELREDEIKPGLTQEEALRNSAKTHNGFFVTKISWN